MDSNIKLILINLTFVLIKINVYKILIKYLILHLLHLIFDLKLSSFQTVLF